MGGTAPRPGKPATAQTAPVVADDPGGADLGVDRIVQEIREGLAHISARELELRRREQDFNRRYRDLQARARHTAVEEHDETERRVAGRLAELNAQSVELAARRARLDDDGQELRVRQLELEAQRRELALQSERARQQAEAVTARQAEQEAALRQRAEHVAQQEAALLERVRQAENEIARQQSEVAARSPELEGRAAKLAATERVLQKRDEELEQRDAELREQIQQAAAEGAREWAALEARSATLDEQAARLAETERDQRQRAAQISQRETELRARMAACDQDITRRNAELDARAAELAEAEKALPERVQATARQEAEQKERLRRMEADLTRQRAEVERRGPELDARAARLAKAEQTLVRRRDDLKRRVSAAKKQVTRLKRKTPAPSTQGAEAAARSAVVAERWSPTGLRVWRRRTIAVAAVAGVVAAAIWLATHPALCVATVELGFTDAPTSAPAEDGSGTPDTAGAMSAGALAEHRRRLLDSQLMAGSPDAAALGDAWSIACAAGRVNVSTAEDPSVLQLHVTDSNTVRAARLAAAAATMYAEQIRSRSGVAAPPGLADLLARRDRLDEALRSGRMPEAGDASEQNVAGDIRQRDETLAAVNQMETELAETANSLNQQRAELAALVAADVPPGSVDPAEVEKTLAEDAIYQEDQKELQAVALQYRTELSVTMLLLVEPLNGVTKALDQLASSLSEQVAEDPPADVAPILAQCTADVSKLEAQATPFAEQWQTALQTVQSMNVRDDVVNLVKLQNSAADAARRIADDMIAGAMQLGQKVERLDTDGTGGTRAVVVAALLRSDHNAVDSAVKNFAAAAAKIALPGNFELDALDRKLRGLRTRVSSRREAVSQRLQLEADHAARQKHAIRVEESREQIRRLDQRREELATGMLANLRKLRTIDESARRHGALDFRVRQRDDEIAWLESRRAEVGREMDELLARWPASGAVEVRDAVIKPLTQARFRDAGLAAVAGFVGTLFISALLLAPNPWRRQRVDTGSSEAT